MAHRQHTVALQVSEQGYIPVDEAARAQHEKLKIGSVVGARIARVRSIAQNQMYWRVLECVVSATGKWRTAEELHLALKCATGHVDLVRLTNGRLIKVPGSTAFDQMNADEFRVYMDTAFRIICDEILDGMSVEELLENAG